MKIKICGITQADNAREVALLGIDAVGLVFYEQSPRHVDVESAIQVVNALPPFINRVGILVLSMKCCVKCQLTPCNFMAMNL